MLYDMRSFEITAYIPSIDHMFTSIVGNVFGFKALHALSLPGCQRCPSGWSHNVVNMNIK